MANNKGSDGSTFTFGSAVTPLRSVEYADNAAKVDVSGMGDTQHEYVAGASDPEVTVELVGQFTTAIGTTNATCSIGFNDSTTAVALGDSVLISKRTRAGRGQEILTTATFAPYGG